MVSEKIQSAPPFREQCVNSQRSAPSPSDIRDAISFREGFRNHLQWRPTRPRDGRNTCIATGPMPCICVLHCLTADDEGFGLTMELVADNEKIVVHEWLHFSNS